MPDALELLKSDHEEVKHLLSELVESSNRAGKRRQQLLEKISEQLRVHTAIEEEIFYPAFRDAGQKADKPMVFEAREEHRAVEEVVLPDLEQADPKSDEFAGYAKVLKEMIEHHAKEEESEMFERAKEILSKEELQELGEKMYASKQAKLKH